MKRIVVGTAGHVDHGKTSLIKALTGTDCDRLKEEKQRGLTIELGFTSLQLPSGEHIGVVDVPGHIKFIRHMLSGASGIDLVILVVAADEGIMPQTREHMQICRLLGVNRGIVALSKIDMVDAELLEMARADVEAFVFDTFLQDAPIIPVSAATGEGVETLRSTIAREITTIKERQITGLPVLPIDRVFTIKGFGTVVTGTLARGTFSDGDEVEILPSGIKSRIRNIQVHDQNVREAMAGMRTAVNVQGVEKQDISRGQWLAPAGVFQPTTLIDTRLELIKKPGRGMIRLHIGTAEVTGTLSLRTLDNHSIARIRLKEPIIAAYGDRFILRTATPSQTLGGGIILNPSPARRFSEEGIRLLLGDDLGAHIQAFTQDAGTRGISRNTLISRFALLPSAIEKSIQDLLARGKLVRFDTQNELYVATGHFQQLKTLITDEVTSYHARNLSAPGISKEHLRTTLKGAIDARLFHKAVLELVKAQILVEEGPVVRKKNFSASLGQASDQTEKLHAILDKAGLEPPNHQNLMQLLGVDQKKLMQILTFMTREGRLVKIKDDIFLTPRHESTLREQILAFLKERQVMSPTDMKTIFGLSRKYAIPYLEYLDRIKFTVRVGNERKLYATHR